MPKIIPVRDLKNTADISELCNSTSEPIFITKNGYGDMVIMSINTYEKLMFKNEVYKKIAEAEKSIEEGNTKDAFLSVAETRKKYEL